MSAASPMVSEHIAPYQHPVIMVRDVSKRFTSNEQRPSLRQDMVALMKQYMGRKSAQPQSPPFLALKHITFTVCSGESVGIIGRNGSGKTTLLRLLSRITSPTSGTLEVRGRAAALIALGAGFRPDLTGRQNIFLNAAMYGVPEREVRDLLSEIIDFSELGQFIDLPVSRYSSGMTARLGFSILFHILPDIIFLDEVLAVGDLGFQEKCKQKIHEIKAQRKTLMLVSHSLESIQEICERTLWLHEGTLMMDGATSDVTSAYRTLIEGSRA